MTIYSKVIALSLIMSSANLLNAAAAAPTTAPIPAWIQQESDAAREYEDGYTMYLSLWKRPASSNMFVKKSARDFEQQLMENLQDINALGQTQAILDNLRIHNPAKAKELQEIFDAKVAKVYSTSNPRGDASRQDAVEDENDDKEFKPSAAELSHITVPAWISSLGEADAKEFKHGYKIMETELNILEQNRKDALNEKPESIRKTVREFGINNKQSLGATQATVDYVKTQNSSLGQSLQNAYDAEVAQLRGSQAAPAAIVTPSGHSASSSSARHQEGRRGEHRGGHHKNGRGHDSGRGHHQRGGRQEHWKGYRQ